MYFSSNLLIEIILLVRKAVRAFGWLEMVYWAMNDFFISVHISLLKMIFSHTLRFFAKNADSLLIFAGTEKFIDNLLNLMGYDPSFMLQSVRNFQCLFYIVIWNCVVSHSIESCLIHSRWMLHFIPPENIRKPLVFRCFQREYRRNIGLKWFRENSEFEKFYEHSWSFISF